MREMYGDLWTIADDMAVSAVCITTNGFVKPDGRLVMGRGVAQQARDRLKGIDRQFGSHVLSYGLQVASIARTGLSYEVVAFPVKPIQGPTGRPGWMEPADMALIERSTRELVEMADKGMPHTWTKWHTVLLPRPGCGAGGLRWADVKSVIEPILDNRFIIVEYKGVTK